jgi:hypothetical protein
MTAISESGPAVLADTCGDASGEIVASGGAVQAATRATMNKVSGRPIIEVTVVVLRRRRLLIRYRAHSATLNVM